MAQKIKQNKKYYEVFKNSRKLNERIQKEMPEISEKIDSFMENYCWVSYNWSGPCYTKKYYLEVLFKLIGSKDLESKINVIKKESKKTENKQKEIYEELKIFGIEKEIFEVAKDLLFAKAYRKEIGFKANFIVESLLNEIGCRLHLTSKQIKFLLPNELKVALLDNKIELDKINERMKYCIWIDINEKEEIFSGKEAKKWVANVIIEKISKDIKEMKGQIAYPGEVIKGVVKIVRKAEDMKGFKKGDILVSPATNPNILQVMKIAAAIVTDEGGITCHATIVSRELKKPCIVGTKIATKVLKDGDLVEVDADNGIVRIISK